MLIWYMCINFGLAQISKEFQNLASFVRPFFMSVPKAQPLRFNTFLRLEQNPRSSSSGNHHQWCRALNLCYHILLIFFQSFSWPQFIALIYEGDLSWFLSSSSSSLICWMVGIENHHQWSQNYYDLDLVHNLWCRPFIVFSSSSSSLTCWMAMRG